jgi:hypothetical protein
MDLVLDVKILIASCSEHVWYIMYRFDDEFRVYAKTEPARVLFVALFTKCSRDSVAPHAIYSLFGQFHREGDLPAVITRNSRVWYRAGMRHRDDKPAYECDHSHATEQLHMWYQYGKLHRDDDQPAVVWEDGAQSWYQHGEMHRDCGKPAIIGPNGYAGWYIRGVAQPAPVVKM